MIEKSVPKGRVGHIFFACLFISALVFPLAVRLLFLQHLMIMIFLYAAITGGWNIISGYCGQVSLG
jgi:branched-chain amino acid transport system permease protein